VSPDKSVVFYAREVRDSATLSVLYTTGEIVQGVRPDGVVVTSAGEVYNATTGAWIGSLPATGYAQAYSADGEVLYLSNPAVLTAIDAQTFQP
jgi:hypothetical protein